MPSIHVHLFGKFCVRYNDATLEGLDGRKVQELLAYLLLYRDHPHSRETLAGTLWGDNTTAQSKRCLRQTLWYAQMALESQIEPTSDRMLLVDAEWVQLNAQADLWFDVAAFEQAFARTTNTPGEELPPHAAQALESAVDLYRGNLLEGWYQEWCLYERERLKDIYLAVLDKLMGYCAVHHEYERGIAYGNINLRYDRARERTHRRLMTLYYLIGDRAGSLRQYERCVKALDEELGVKPAQSTIAVYDQIRADRLVVPPPARKQADVSHPLQPSLLSSLLIHLNQYSVALKELQHQLDEDIRLAQKMLNE